MNEKKEPFVPLMLALSGYLIWGFLPLYLKQMSEISPWVITANRVLWAIPWAGFLALLIHGYRNFKVSPKTLLLLLLSALFIGANWTIYAWCVANNRIMETALGYFVNPLMNVAVGVIFFKERLGKLKLAAILMAAIGVIYQAIALNHFPLLGLCLAALFAGYGIVRKQAVVPPAVGLFWESLLISPLAIFGLYYLSSKGFAVVGANQMENFWLLMSGPATAIPLILFAFGARALKLTTLGMLQYTAPTIAFCISIFYGESFGIHQAITFALIWCGLALYTFAEFKPKQLG